MDISDYLIIDYGSIVLPYNCGLISGLSSQGKKISFIGSHTIYDDGFSAKIARLCEGRVKLFNISKTSGRKFRNIVDIVSLLLFLVRNRKIANRIICTFPKSFVIDTCLKIIFGRNISFVIHNAWPHESIIKIDPLVQWIILFSDFIIVPSEYTSTMIKKKYLLSNCQVRVVQHGLIDIGPISPKPVMEKNKKKIVFLGRVKKYKGPDFLFHLASQRLVLGKCFDIEVAGKFDSSLDWEEKFKQFNIATRNKQLDNLALLEIISDKPIFILPYRHIFQSGMFYLLLNYDSVCICSNVGDLALFYRRFGLEQLLFDVTDPVSVFESIEFAFENYEDISSRLRQIKRHFEWEVVIRSLVGFDHDVGKGFKKAESDRFGR